MHSWKCLRVEKKLINETTITWKMTYNILYLNKNITLYEN